MRFALLVRLFSGIAGLATILACGAQHQTQIRTNPMTGAVEKFIPVLRVSSVQNGAPNLLDGNMHGTNLLNFIERASSIEVEVSYYSRAEQNFFGQFGPVHRCTEDRAQFSFDGQLVERVATRPGRISEQSTEAAQSVSIGQVFVFEGEDALAWKSANVVLVNFCDSIVSVDPDAIAQIRADM